MKVLLIDAAPLMLRATGGPVLGFSTKAGEPTGLRFGVLRSIRSYEKKTRVDRVALVFDGTHLPEGVDYPTSKTHLPQNQEFLGATMRGDAGRRGTSDAERQKIWGELYQLREMLSLSKYTHAWAEDYEAPDCLAAIARHFANDGHQVLIASEDLRLAQEITNHVTLWQPDKKRGVYTGLGECLQSYGVIPRHARIWWAATHTLNPHGRKEDQHYLGRFRAFLREAAVPGGLDYGGYSDALEGWCDDTQKILFGADLEERWDEAGLNLPATMNLIRGVANATALRNHLAAMECDSLVKRVEEFAKREELI